MECTGAAKYLNPEKVLFIAIQQQAGRNDISTKEFTDFLQKNGVLWRQEETQAVFDFFAPVKTSSVSSHNLLEMMLP